MKVIIYGDFNCPYSYLASQRADLLSRAGVGVDWRAVEHDLGLPVTGSRADSGQAVWDRELAEVASFALPGERVPDRPPVLISNTKAAVAAYAEAVSDGVADELRRRLFRAIWAQGQHLSSAYEVRRLITGVMWPQEDITGRLSSPDIPSLLLRDPDLARIDRRSGGTIAADGGPLSTVGWRRIRRWRQEWLALPSQVIPAVIGPNQVLRPGIEGLCYLADLANTVDLQPRLHAETAPGRDSLILFAGSDCGGSRVLTAPALSGRWRMSVRTDRTVRHRSWRVAIRDAPPATNGMFSRGRVRTWPPTPQGVKLSVSAHVIGVGDGGGTRQHGDHWRSRGILCCGGTVRSWMDRDDIGARARCLAGRLRDPGGRLIAVPDALVEFIEARLAEDEAVARACEDSGGRRVWYGSRESGSAGHVIQTQAGEVVARIGRDDVSPGAVAAFIAAHDPHRALRRVRVLLRDVLAEFSGALAEQEKLLARPGGDKSVAYEWEKSREIALRRVLLRIAAAEWGEHPGYGAAIEHG